MDISLENSLRELCEISAPGTIFGILDRFKNVLGDIEKNEILIEKLALDHLEKYLILIPIKNLDQNYDFPIWGIICKYARVQENCNSNSKNSENLYKYIDPSLKIKLLIQASSLQVFDIERFENNMFSSISTYIRELENIFLDPQVSGFSTETFPNQGKEIFIKKQDINDFNTPVRRTVIYDSTTFPLIGNGKETIMIVRSSINFKRCNNKSGVWNSQWKFEFPKDESNKKLVWKGEVNLHCYDSESGNSHLFYKGKDLVLEVFSEKYSNAELIDNPSMFARESAKAISIYEGKIQSKINDLSSKFKNKYVKKLRRILPVNPVKFDWSRFNASIQNSLEDALVNCRNNNN